MSGSLDFFFSTDIYLMKISTVLILETKGFNLNSQVSGIAEPVQHLSYRLDIPQGTTFRILLAARDFHFLYSAHTDLCSHQASYSMGTFVSLSMVKAAGP
jgi:hypothetical protein